MASPQSLPLISLLPSSQRFGILVCVCGGKLSVLPPKHSDLLCLPPPTPDEGPRRTELSDPGRSKSNAQVPHACIGWGLAGPCSSSMELHLQSPGLGIQELDSWPPPCRIQPATSSILFWTDSSVFRTFAPLVTSKPHTPSLHLQVLTTMDLSAPNSNVSPSCFLHGVPALAYLNIVSHLSFTYLTHTCVVPPVCQHLC